MSMMEVVAIRRTPQLVGAPTGTSAESRERAPLEIGGITLKPVFEPARLPRAVASAGGAPSAPLRLDRYYRVVAERGEALEIAQALRARDDIETAYVKPRPLLPLAPDQPELELAPAIADQPVPDFAARQGYHAPAPEGVAIDAAWALPGGMGDDVRIIDIEGGWCLDHFDLGGNGGLAGGDPYPELDWRNHGTAVLGVLIAEDNSSGVRGLAPNARGSAFTHRLEGPAGAIQRAADLLGPGDLLLLEMHSPGPRYDFEERDDQAGYVAVEWWPDCYDAIRYAIRRGVVVVEAAGNGAEDLDDPFYDASADYFPEDWSNPFLRRDSGAILVGAGTPAGGGFGAPRSRLDFSNYGTRVDCQGWGRAVCTTGYGDLYAGSGERQWFTREFSGTSSASPIVTGVAACLQGIAKKRGAPLSPLAMRQLLRDNGSEQQGPNEPIGRLPDLGKLVGKL